MPSLQLAPRSLSCLGGVWSFWGGLVGLGITEEGREDGSKSIAGYRSQCVMTLCKSLGDKSRSMNELFLSAFPLPLFDDLPKQQSPG
jgi:hypothetical protein